MAKENKSAENVGVAYFDHPDQVPEPGFYTVVGEIETDENGVKHDSNCQPGDRVYPSEQGFVSEPPTEEGGE